MVYRSSTSPIRMPRYHCAPAPVERRHSIILLERALSEDRIIAVEITCLNNTYSAQSFIRQDPPQWNYGDNTVLDLTMRDDDLSRTIVDFMASNAPSPPPPADLLIFRHETRPGRMLDCSFTEWNDCHIVLIGRFIFYEFQDMVTQNLISPETANILAAQTFIRKQRDKIRKIEEDRPDLSRFRLILGPEE